MTLLEDVKKAAERLTGWRRPSATEIGALLRAPKCVTFRFADDGRVPNHPHWPFVVFRKAVRLPRALDPAAVFEEIFAANGWGDSWRNGIYDYVHYHPRIHEVLGVARGSARVRFGGQKGRTVKITAGDVAVLPAGTGHQCVSASEDFLVVGAYPPVGEYEEYRGTAEEHERALKSVPKVARPRKDPLFGRSGPLFAFWKTPPAKSKGKRTPKSKVR
jgi:uncharacterized protein YjlB